MLAQDHLIGYGVNGDFGRFRAAAPLDAARGHRVVVRTPRGVELGHVLRAADERLARWLPNTSVGPLLRLAADDDERLARDHARRAGDVLRRGAQIIGQLGLPLTLIDVEILLDGQHAVLHLLGWQACDARDLVRPLSSEFDLLITLADLATAPVEEKEEDHGCGTGSCGSGGGCGDCSSGGCGSCSTPSADDKAHFSELRDAMQRRVTLL